MLIEEKALAKLNISLDVGHRREDGYHDMVMIMQSVALADDVTITLDGTGTVGAVTNLPFVPGDDRNLAVKAAKVFLSAAGEEDKGAQISIFKRIPVGAGMAGGSADAAAVLRGLNRAFGGCFSREELASLAEKVGSDVAFCLFGGTMLATGRGELLSPLPPLPDCHIVICKPRFSISTPELFGKLDQMTLRRHPDTEGLKAALARGDLPGICRRMYNVFEDVDDRRLKTVSEVKSRLFDCGALGAMMTGTGSAVYGIFRMESTAARAIAPLRKDYGFCTLTRPLGIVI